MVAMRKKSPYPHHSSKCSAITHRWIKAATSENPAMGYRMVLGGVQGGWYWWPMCSLLPEWTRVGRVYPPQSEARSYTAGSAGPSPISAGSSIDAVDSLVRLTSKEMKQ